MPHTTLLAINNVCKSHGEPETRVEILRRVSLTLRPGETLGLTGESGSGKSTLLHLAAGLDEVDAGQIAVDGKDLSDLDDAGRARLRRDTIGIVFQQFNLIPSLDAAANIAFQARLSGRYDAARTATLIARLGLSEHAEKYPEQLSGGQQQRVAIGRALAARPRLILADEPTGNLDEETGARVMDLMLDLVAEVGAALLLVTHSAGLAARMDRTLRLSQGRIALDRPVRADE